MSFARRTGWLVPALVFTLGLASPAGAQSRSTTITSIDIQRLQDRIYDTDRDIADMRGRDPSLASQLQNELDDARDDATYLKVKLRRRESVSSNEFAELRDRIDDIRSRARDRSAGAPPLPPNNGSIEVERDRDRRPPPPPARTNRNEIPVGTEFDVRLQHPLNSRTARVEDRVEGTTLVDLLDGDRVLVPAGSLMRGTVTSVQRAGRIERRSSITVEFDTLVVRNRTYPIRATVDDALESEGIRGEADRIGTGAGVGAIIGGILGGVKGAIAGILIGGGGVIAATEGEDVNLPAGAVLRVRLDSPVTVR